MNAVSDTGGWFYARHGLPTGSTLADLPNRGIGDTAGKRRAEQGKRLDFLLLLF